MRLIEAFIASLGILVAGWVTIPLAGHLAGVAISTQQSMVMGAFFFALRLVWLYALRVYFSRRERAALRAQAHTV